MEHVYNDIMYTYKFFYRRTNYLIAMVGERAGKQQAYMYMYMYEVQEAYIHVYEASDLHEVVRCLHAPTTRMVCCLWLYLRHLHWGAPMYDALAPRCTLNNTVCTLYMYNDNNNVIVRKGIQNVFFICSITVHCTGVFGSIMMINPPTSNRIPTTRPTYMYWPWPDLT